jgi:hypothetical protein
VPEGDEEGVGARVQLALSVAQAVICLEEEEHRRRHTSGETKVQENCRAGGKVRKLDALEHVYDLAEVLLGVTADLRAVSCSVALTQPNACSAGSNHVTPGTIGEHGREQWVVVAYAEAVADLGDCDNDDSQSNDDGRQG